MSGVFPDTVGLLGVWNASDQWHAAAKAARLRLIDGDEPLWTTNLILAECGNRAARRDAFRTLVADFRDEMEAGGSVIIPTADEERAAWAAFRRGMAGQAGVVDHVSFVVMRRLGITRAFTCDAHFRAAGFITLF